jgi:hypothetical protein
MPNRPQPASRNASAKPACAAIRCSRSALMTTPSANSRSMACLCCSRTSSASRPPVPPPNKKPPTGLGSGVFAELHLASTGLRQSLHQAQLDVNPHIPRSSIARAVADAGRVFAKKNANSGETRGTCCPPRWNGWRRRREAKCCQNLTITTGPKFLVRAEAGTVLFRLALNVGGKARVRTSLIAPRPQHPKMETSRNGARLHDNEFMNG